LELTGDIFPHLLVLGSLKKLDIKGCSKIKVVDVTNYLGSAEELIEVIDDKKKDQVSGN